METVAICDAGGLPPPQKKRPSATHSLLKNVEGGKTHSVVFWPLVRNPKHSPPPPPPPKQPQSDICLVSIRYWKERRGEEEKELRPLSSVFFLLPITKTLPPYVCPRRAYASFKYSIRLLRKKPIRQEYSPKNRSELKLDHLNFSRAGIPRCRRRTGKRRGRPDRRSRSGWRSGPRRIW